MIYDPCTNNTVMDLCTNNRVMDPCTINFMRRTATSINYSFKPISFTRKPKLEPNQELHRNGHPKQLRRNIYEKMLHCNKTKINPNRTSTGQK